MIFVDSNIPMYLVGAAHQNKGLAQIALERLVAEKQRIVTSVEVFQEILHRYAAIHRRDAIQPAFDLLNGIVDEVFPIESRDIERAKVLVVASRSVSARDALHVATMENRRVQQILSFDSGFDSFEGVIRIAR